MYFLVVFVRSTAAHRAGLVTGARQDTLIPTCVSIHYACHQLLHIGFVFLYLSPVLCFTDHRVVQVEQAVSCVSVCLSVRLITFERHLACRLPRTESGAVIMSPYSFV